MQYFLLALISVILFGIVLITYFQIKYKKSLNKSRIDFFIKKIKTLSSSSFSTREKILEYDKIYHKILLEAGYKGTFGDILKKKVSEIGDINHIWELHKLRNKLAHDMLDIPEKILDKKSLEFEKEVLNLINKFK